MQNYLRFDLQPKNHPHPNDPSTRLEAWGRITIRLLTPESEIRLFDWEWNLDLLAEWFAAHSTALCCKSIEEYIQGCTPAPEESLAEVIERCRARDYSEFANDDEHFQWFSRIDSYLEAHSLTAALPGARVPPIRIGLNHEAGEISLSTREGEDEAAKWWDPVYSGRWAYSFDMADFCRHLRLELEHFLAKWGASSTDPDVQAQANNLIAQLRSDYKS